MKKSQWAKILGENRESQIICLWGSGSWSREELYNIEQTIPEILKETSGIFKVLTVPSRADYIRRYAFQGLFFQQRFQSMYNDQGQTVRQSLKEAGKDLPETEIEKYGGYFDLGEMYEKPLIQLSTGEWKRFSLCLTLLRKPGALIFVHGLDGLDVSWQQRIPDLLTEKFKNIKPIIITADQPVNHHSVRNIPVSELRNMTSPVPAAAVNPPSEELVKSFQEYRRDLPRQISESPLVEMDSVSIRYGQNQILDRISWTVNATEKWNVRGPNGAGKSTLLSLVNADNPQGYSQKIRLFGRPYGQTTIWERKARIAYFSSDYFQYYRSTKSMDEVIHQHLKTPYLETPIPSEDLLDQLSDYFGLSSHRDTSYARLDPVLRRQALLLATYLKSSELLLLDEPYHDFDQARITQNNLFLEATQKRIPQTVVFVTHRSDHMPLFINRALEINQGRAREVPL